MHKDTDKFFTDWLRSTFRQGCVMAALGVANLTIAAVRYSAYRGSVLNIIAGVVCLSVAYWLFFSRPDYIRRHWFQMRELEGLETKLRSTINKEIL